MFADYHVHSYYSDDSNCLMEKYIQQAIKLGIKELCFTDHIDYGTPYAFGCDCEKYTKEIYELQNKYNNLINIKLGMEFGAQAHHVEYFQNIFNIATI